MSICRACECIRMGWGQITDIHTCPRWGGQRSLKFVENKMSYSHPKVEWVGEDELSQDQSSMLLTSIVHTFNQLPKSVQDRFCEYFSLSKL